jgi:hypothetical protein
MLYGPEEKNGELFAGEVTLWRHRGNGRPGNGGMEGGWGKIFNTKNM